MKVHAMRIMRYGYLIDSRGEAAKSPCRAMALEKIDFYAPDIDTFVLFDEQHKVKAATFPKLITFLTDAKGVGTGPLSLDNRFYSLDDARQLACPRFFTYVPFFCLRGGACAGLDCSISHRGSKRASPRSRQVCSLALSFSSR